MISGQLVPEVFSSLSPLSSSSSSFVFLVVLVSLSSSVVFPFTDVEVSFFPEEVVFSTASWGSEGVTFDSLYLLSGASRIPLPFPVLPMMIPSSEYPVRKPVSQARGAFQLMVHSLTDQASMLSR